MLDDDTDFRFLQRFTRTRNHCYPPLTWECFPRYSKRNGHNTPEQEILIDSGFACSGINGRRSYWDAGLILPESLHRIHSRCAAGRNCRCQQGGQEQADRYHAEQQRVEAGCAKVGTQHTTCRKA